MRVSRFFFAVLLFGGLFGSQTAAARDCFDRADEAFEICEDKCRTNSCFDRCDRKYDDDLMRCEQNADATGDNGCYFGRCPGDESGDRPSDTSKSRTTERTDTSRTTPQQPQVRYASVCMTQWGTCSMLVTIPVGSVCTCYMPTGAFPGIAQ